jgi:DNA-binding NtrC family response regulator
MNKILIVDDDIAVTNHLKVFLTQTETYESRVINDSSKVLDALHREPFDAVLLDIDMPNVSGIDILQAVHDQALGVAIVVLTGVGDVDLAVRAMKLGAYDYLTKPVEEDTLLRVLDESIRHKAIRQSISGLPAELSTEDLTHGEAFAQFPTQDPALIRCFHEAERMAAGDTCIFIWGERGTYKEMLARAIHGASPRRNGPFVSVDVAAREPSRFAAEFFGQGRDWSGAREEAPGLVEQAAGGTLFLDEIDLLSIPVQVRLRRLIQAGDFYRENTTKTLKADDRIIAASHYDLTQEYYKKMFSRDLLYHLMTHSLRIPALLRRAGDIPLLTEYFLKIEAKAKSKRVAAVAPELMELLKPYDFPDNVRELRNIIAAAVADEDGEVLGLDSLPPHVRDTLTRAVDEKTKGFRPRRLDEIEREHVAKTLAYFNHERGKAAESLGISEAAMDAVLGGEAKGS